MERGLSLVELLVSLTISTILILAIYSVYSLVTKGYIDSRDSWYCMQSLRSSLIQIDSDLKQCAYLLPQDLKVACKKNSLFISGAPVSSSYSGLSLHSKISPPYFSVIRSSDTRNIELDTIDIDQNNTPDYCANLGIITDSGPYVISNGFKQKSAVIPLTSHPNVKKGDRSVPSVHYELKNDGLYRNAQLLAEGVRAFDAKVNGKSLILELKACHNGEAKSLSYTYELK